MNPHDIDLQDNKWDFFRLPIFDTPDPKLALIEYEKRVAEILPRVPIDSPILVYKKKKKKRRKKMGYESWDFFYT
jgi:hypothetical protein